MNPNGPAIFGKRNRDFTPDALCGAGYQRMPFGFFSHVVKMRYVGYQFKGLRAGFLILSCPGASPVRQLGITLMPTNWLAMNDR
jgi:hypothetical protein